MLYSLIVAPIECVVDWVFNFMTNKFSNLGIIGAVCGVSLIINFLALPLYNIADSLQEKERKAAKALEVRVKRIKKAFKGNEQFMMLSTYYRQNDYHPLYVLRSSLSILIEIPFFIAAYHYLSNCEVLRGSSFWIFKDLGAPDGLMHIGNFPINVLPIIMTLINFVSGAIYTKEAPFREKIQLYIVAALFLVLLYSSPSGLVIYWILNNLFSLVKNIVMKMKQPGKILHIVVSSLLFLLSVCFIAKNGKVLKKALFLIFSLCVAFAPIVWNKFLSRKISISKNIDTKNCFVLLLASGIGLALLVGLLLPANIIATSPIEFSFLGKTDSPVSYIRNTLFVALGFFVFWPLCIYKMFSLKVKVIESFSFAVIFFLAFADAFVFKFNYGVIDTTLTLEESSVLNDISLFNLIAPFLAVLLFAAIFFILAKAKKTNYAALLIIAVSIGSFGIGITKISHIKKIYTAYSFSRSSQAIKDETVEPVYHLTKEGKNVVVLFLDRAISSFLPYALNDNPELSRQLSGFVYYPNTLSFSSNTDLASPALMAGYEYTPEKLNERASELLKDKHNEASLVMPIIFADAGFEVTITDPPFPNYTWKGDLSNFKNKKNIKAYELFGKYADNLKKELNLGMEKRLDLIVKKEMFNFAVLETLPPLLRSIFYGNFRKTDYTKGENFLNMVSCLYYLPELTSFNTKSNQFIFIDNETTHEPTYLSDDFLTICEKYEAPECSYKTKDEEVFIHYQAFVAAFKQLGKWLDFLRENNAFDNTRIIIVSDHGKDIRLSDFSNFSNPVVPSTYNALLLVKDFDSSNELSTDKTFMTNADTLFIAKKNLPVSNVNPFTNQIFKQQKENGINVYLVEGTEWNAEQMIDKTKFTLNRENAFHVSDDIFQESNWHSFRSLENCKNGGSK